MPSIMAYMRRHPASEKGPSVARQKRPTHAGSLEARIQQAMAEQRFQHALELARQQFREEPPSAHRQLFSKAARGRARQLREHGASREATAVLKAQLDGAGVTD